MLFCLLQASCMFGSMLAWYDQLSAATNTPLGTLDGALTLRATSLLNTDVLTFDSCMKVSAAARWPLLVSTS